MKVSLGNGLLEFTFEDTGLIRALLGVYTREGVCAHYSVERSCKTATGSCHGTVSGQRVASIGGGSFAKRTQRRTSRFLHIIGAGGKARDASALISSIGQRIAPAESGVLRSISMRHFYITCFFWKCKWQTLYDNGSPPLCTAKVCVLSNFAAVGFQMCVHLVMEMGRTITAFPNGRSFGGGNIFESEMPASASLTPLSIQSRAHSSCATWTETNSIRGQFERAAIAKRRA